MTAARAHEKRPDSGKQGGSPRQDEGSQSASAASFGWIDGCRSGSGSPVGSGEKSLPSFLSEFRSHL
ncbi:hypothetical protein N136_00686 [Leifsonia aquatica ATCC 14665]|uniref:Uncharacterized protein n=1 Tax=Leifsonia aquatica ATCC 14665 TaxID=1358026 RepID=U2RWS0_LEIAQ|nr:hypothetical protein N136_00686 [Leifsonia aquatica ATCC 14665]